MALCAWESVTDGQLSTGVPGFFLREQSRISSVKACPEIVFSPIPTGIATLSPSQHCDEVSSPGAATAYTAHS